MSQVSDPKSFDAKPPSIDTSDLQETCGMVEPGCVLALAVHLGNNAAGEPVLGHLRITDKEVEDNRGEKFLDLMIAKCHFIKKCLGQYAKSQTN